MWIANILGHLQHLIGTTNADAQDMCDRRYPDISTRLPYHHSRSEDDVNQTCISHGQLQSATALHIAERNIKIVYIKHKLKHWVLGPPKGPNTSEGGDGPPPRLDTSEVSVNSLPLSVNSCPPNSLCRVMIPVTGITDGVTPPSATSSSGHVLHDIRHTAAAKFVTRVRIWPKSNMPGGASACDGAIVDVHNKSSQLSY